MSEEETGGVPQADREWKAKPAVTPESPTDVVDASRLKEGQKLVGEIHDAGTKFLVPRSDGGTTEASVVVVMANGDLKMVWSESDGSTKTKDVGLQDLVDAQSDPALSDKLKQLGEVVGLKSKEDVEQKDPAVQGIERLNDLQKSGEDFLIPRYSGEMTPSTVHSIAPGGMVKMTWPNPDQPDKPFFKDVNMHVLADAQKDSSLAAQMHEIGDLFGVPRKEKSVSSGEDNPFLKAGQFPIPESLRAQAAIERAKRAAEPAPARVERPARAVEGLHASYPIASVEERTHKIPAQLRAGTAIRNISASFGPGKEIGRDFDFRVNAELLPALRERLKDPEMFGDPETVALIGETWGLLVKKSTGGNLSKDEASLRGALFDLMQEAEGKSANVG